MTDFENFVRDMKHFAQFEDETMRGEYTPRMARAMLERIETSEGLANALLDVLPRYDVSLTIEHNEHKCCYESAEDYCEGVECGPDWVSDAEKLQAYETNEVWAARWYPDTPVGSHHVAASTLSALLSWLMSADDGRTQD